MPAALNREFLDRIFSWVDTSFSTTEKAESTEGFLALSYGSYWSYRTYSKGWAVLFIHNSLF